MTGRTTNKTTRISKENIKHPKHVTELDSPLSEVPSSISPVAAKPTWLKQISRTHGRTSRLLSCHTPRSILLQALCCGMSKSGKKAPAEVTQRVGCALGLFPVGPVCYRSLQPPHLCWSRPAPSGSGFWSYIVPQDVLRNHCGFKLKLCSHPFIQVSRAIVKILFADGTPLTPLNTMT